MAKEHTKSKPLPKATPQVQRKDGLLDAYKFISWAMRQLAKQVGYEFGDPEFDANLAGAASSFIPAETLAKRDEATNLCLNACAGAYKGVKR